MQPPESTTPTKIKDFGRGLCMIGPDHMYNLIIGFLGELPLHTERFSLI
ncbi:MAG: hypothetical protein BTN85_0452 [Candidatus Methanohalarchaeum thermophilum]|uniref:Uncharacterized protein n=1 Tax=Methanohalarchaeum thermophilum TaxID=1903181 RepID=A0A1Q6DUD0_METT1|nr:MAG: hypothetical protein BTN85_0452 [Candidatus Methanohalarchaeum thermophilum]